MRSVFKPLSTNRSAMHETSSLRNLQHAVSASFVAAANSCTTSNLTTNFKDGNYFKLGFAESGAVHHSELT
eukprot:3918933-Amphidinium_carterae.1